LTGRVGEGSSCKLANGDERGEGTFETIAQGPWRRGGEADGIDAGEPSGLRVGMRSLSIARVGALRVDARW
jgi:hypothetical protein